MSSYATPSDLFDLVEALRTSDPGRLTAIQAQLDAASDEADGYLSGRYRLPLQTGGWGKDLTQKVCMLATLPCFGPGFNPDTPEYKYLKSQEEDARTWLRAVRDNRIVPRLRDASTDGLGETRDTGYVVAIHIGTDGEKSFGPPKRRW